MKLNEPMKCALIVIGTFILIRLVQARCNSSNYRLSPSSIGVEVDPSVVGKTIFDLPYKMECVPGSEPTSAYYTKDLTPGGVCGGQKFVQSSADYKIVSGIGGSLL